MGRLSGIIYPNAFQISQLVSSMLLSLRHRGGGREDTVVAYKNLELGGARASTWSNPQKTIWVLLDGTIYNAKAICAKMRDRGHKVDPTRIDQVLIFAYITWGKDFIKHVIGSYSLVLFDNKKERLLLYRDPLGKRPLYWYSGHQHFAFASELKALLATGIVPQTPAEPALAAYLYFGFMPQDLTPVKEANKLRPGHMLQVDLDGSYVVKSFWSLQNHLLQESSSEEPKSRVRHLISKAVQDRLDAYQDISCTLTGDTRSAWLAYELREQQPDRNLRTYLLEYPNQPEEEKNSSSLVAEKLNLMRCSQELEAVDLLDQLVKMVWYLDEPVATPEVVECWLLAKLQSAPCALLSPAGSSQFCQYRLPEYTQKSSTFNYSMPTWLTRSAFSCLKRFHPKLAFQWVQRQSLPSHFLQTVQAHSVFSHKEIKSLSPQLYKYFNPYVFAQTFYENLPIKNLDQAGMYFDLVTRLPDSTLLAQDRLRGPHEINWCTPFLDQRVVEEACKLHHDSSHSCIGMEVLPPPVHQILPNNIPFHYQRSRLLGNHWVQQSDFKKISQLLLDGALIEQGLLSRSRLKYLLQHFSLHPLYLRQFWTILILETWFRLYIQQPMAISAPKINIIELFNKN